MKPQVTIDLSEYNNLRDIRKSVINKDNIVYTNTTFDECYNLITIHSLSDVLKDHHKEIESLNKRLVEKNKTMGDMSQEMIDDRMKSLNDSIEFANSFKTMSIIHFIKQRFF